MSEGTPSETDQLVVLGAGYAGLTVAREVRRRSKGKIPVVLVDRNPLHVLRTQLYEVGKMASDPLRIDTWAVPLAKLLDGTQVEFRQGTLESIDLAAKTVRLDSGTVRWKMLAICLGSVAAYYGVPGAEEHTHTVYRLSRARTLAKSLLETEEQSSKLPSERQPRIIIVGGGSTGTELAAEIATTDWTQVTGGPSRSPAVFLVTGSLPFLVGLPPRLIDHARSALLKAGVCLIAGLNVVKVDSDRLSLEDESVLRFDLAIWCAGLQAPPAVAKVSAPHGKGGRIQVTETLETPGHPGVFAVGDSAEFRDPETGMMVPGTAQAAIAEARAAAVNIVAAWTGGTPTPFRYKEQGVLVGLGPRKGAATIRHLTIWGSPAALLKRIVQREYARSIQKGEPSTVL